MIKLNFEESKEKYEQITAPKKLKWEVNKMFKIKKGYTKKLVIGTTAAAMMIAFTASLNISPVFASSVAGIPGMKSIVKVLTINRYEMNENNFSANIDTPKIEGILDKELEEKLNQEFKDEAEHLIASFEKDMKEFQAIDPEAHMGLTYGYTIRTDNEDVLVVDIYTVNTVGSSSTVHKFYTIDKKTGSVITLASLFKESTDYRTMISEYIRNEMNRQNETKENFYWTLSEDDAFTMIKEDQSFYINTDGKLVIAFDKYEVAPGSSGSPEFVIPDEVIVSIMK